MVDPETPADAQETPPPADAGRREHVRTVVENLRTRLLDLTNRNPLLNFHFSDRSRKQARVIDELPDVLYEKLVEDEKSLVFDHLPDPETEPQDETTPEFARALDEAMLTDEGYKTAMEALGPDDTDSEAAAKIERALRDRIREQLGLPPWSGDARLHPGQYARTLGWNPSFDLPEASTDGQTQPNHEDNRIRTLLFRDQIQRKLSGVREGARLSLQELGVNSLFLTFGFLEWYESDSSDKKHFAPILLQPVELRQKLIHHVYQYSIVSTGDETEVNITLREKLRNDFGIELPEFKKDDKPEAYFEEVREAVVNLGRWRVRRFVTLGLFSFSRLVMYKDLDPASWPAEQPLEAHEVLANLLGGSESDAPIAAADYDVDDPTIASKVPVLISEADASQFSAIVDVLDGRNMAIEGPPGTGKSQTITNMIAAALSLKKRVLFVAEKMAALEVVKKRLDDAGIGDFCFELHSTKSKKRTILDALKQRLELPRRRKPRDFEETLKEYEKHRKKLTAYAIKLNTPIGATGRTLHEVLWSGTRSTDKVRELAIFAELNTITLEHALEWNEPELGSKRAVLGAIQEKAAELLARHPSLRDHPWACLGVQVRSPFDLEEANEQLDHWKDALIALQAVATSANNETHSSFPASLTGLEDLLRCIRGLPRDANGLDGAVLSTLKDLEIVGAVETFLRDVAEHTRQLQSLTPAFQCSENELPTAQALRGSYDRVHKTLPGGPDKTLVIDQFPEIASRYADWADRLDRTAEGVGKLLKAYGIDGAATARTASAICRFSRLLRATARDILELRSEPLCRENVGAMLSELEEESRALTAERNRLEERCVLRYDDDAVGYDAAARTLRVTGFFGRLFGREYREARNVWRMIQKTNRKARPFIMATELDDVRDHIERHRKFQADQRARELCGTQFRGTETDFERLRGVADFAAEVARIGASGDPVTNDLSRVILKEEPERLRELADTLSASDADRIDRLVTELKSASESLLERDFDALTRELRTAASQLPAMCEELKGMQVDGSVRVAELPELESHLVRLRELRERMDGTLQGLGFLRMLDLPSAAVDDNILRTLTFAKTALAANPPESFRTWCFCPAVTERLATASKIQEEILVAMADEKARREQVKDRVRVDPELAVGGSVDEGMLLEDAIGRLEGLLDALDSQGDWTELCRLRHDVEVAGLGDFLDRAWDKQVMLTHLEACFDFVYYHAVLQKAYEEDRDIQRLSGRGQEAVRQQFQTLDKEMLQLHRRKLAAELGAAPIPSGVGSGLKRDWTDQQLIRHEIGKKRRHIPTRDLVRRAGGALLALKPCWMMSPASVAQYVPAGSQLFDIVVVDEASQMRPEEALGAVARGAQLVVVGDPKQLPPTSFFERGEDIDEDDEHAEDYVDNESILDMAFSIFRPNRSLKWHYRSQHESLIAFSNRHFYDDSLVLFPSPRAETAELGVDYCRVEGRYSRGGTNVPEFQAVAEAAVKFMDDHPDRTLGVVTMNRKQTELLQEEMNRLFQENEEADGYRVRHEETLEPFFVKNLENVQGDERDVIFISTVYGPDETGRVLQRFGPINSETGHRRLNVLFTRAKQQVVVFSSMRSGDVRPTPTGRRGVVVLRDYLHYAETGHLEIGADTGRPPDSDFEIAVAERLKRHGFEVVPQVGVSGFFIDMAVRAPGHRGTYLLGIECDGATYHSAKSARDRDRLRQEVLERLGWKLYRIWSTDWYQDPEGETKKLLAHIGKLVKEDELHVEA